MKGLLIKDLCLSRQLKKLVFIIVIVSCIMLYGDPTKIHFVTGYIMLISTTFTLSTLSYDDYNNDMAFLMTLPITRKQYVYEKYLFGILSILSGWLAALLLIAFFSVLKGIYPDWMELLAAMLAIFGIGTMTISLSLPFQLKYGTEKGRIAMIIVFMAFFLILTQIAKYTAHLSLPLQNTLNSILQLQWFWLIAAFFLLLFFILSVILSLRIMEKKEF